MLQKLRWPNLVDPG